MNDPNDKPNVPTSRAELCGKTAVVTGASKGIGRAIALQLADAGAHVLVHANSSVNEADAVAASIQSTGGLAQVVLCDLSQSEQQDRLVQEAWGWRGDVDIWVNNAGVDVLTGPRAKLTFEEKIEQLWRVDVLATVRLSRAVGQRMIDRGGVILNIGWDQAERGMAGDSGEMFTTIKGAVMAFTRSLAQSLAPRVRVNCLAPGWIQTDWGHRASGAWQARARGDSLMDRWGSVDDVARAARYLVGPAGSFVNGQVLAVNGGFRYGPPPTS